MKENIKNVRNSDEKDELGENSRNIKENNENIQNQKIFKKINSCFVYIKWLILVLKIIKMY